MKKKILLVTGATGGIGEAIVNYFDEAGYKILIHCNSNIQKAKKIQASTKNESHIFLGDISNVDNCEDLINYTMKKFNRIDVLINNAAYLSEALLPFASNKDFNKIMNINLFGPFNLMKLVSKIFIKNKFGRIINISSVVAHCGGNGLSLYSASKGGMHSMTLCAARDLAHYNITANIISPGAIKSNMTKKLVKKVRDEILEKIPLKRFGSPEDIANAALFLASEKTSYITGTTIHVNGGMYMS